ncbi:MAG: hypothetical protein NC398_11630 [Acetatifactor muris]|nr:hypothetical protein [Acetatifactor muris]MCM1559601.1 hypothetical protein [Butyrivibrio sp.]
MPNHVKNIVRMEGITKLPLFKTEYDEYEKRDVTCFDFNKIIPMPESLNMVSGSIETLAIEAVNRRLSQRRYGFQQKYSQPQMSDEEYQQRIESHGKTEEELLDLGLQYISNKVKYGATSWYDWCCDNWGTKWNAYSNEQEDEDTISFETAWSNPEPVMLKLSEMYPEATIEHWWADEDMGSNDGYRVYQGGQIVDGDYCDSCSNEAYEIYIKCWGESECLYQDEDGMWKRHECSTCHKCD